MHQSDPSNRRQQDAIEASSKLSEFVLSLNLSLNQAAKLSQLIATYSNAQVAIASLPPSGEEETAVGYSPDVAITMSSKKTKRGEIPELQPLLNEYIKKHSPEKCKGFIDGIKAYCEMNIQLRDLFDISNSIAFIDWIYRPKNNLIRTFQGLWEIYDNDGNFKSLITTAELYTLYLESKTQGK